MQEATLVRALAAVREKITEVDETVADWLAERERRRRQEAAILRGIVRARGSQRQAALVTGLNHSTISRILDREGHKKQRVAWRARKLVASSQKLATPEPDEPEEIMPTNVVKLRRRRRDWHPRQPRRPEMHIW